MTPAGLASASVPSDTVSVPLSVLAADPPRKDGVVCQATVAPPPSQISARAGEGAVERGLVAAAGVHRQRVAADIDRSVQRAGLPAEGGIAEQGVSGKEFPSPRSEVGSV